MEITLNHSNPPALNLKVGSGALLYKCEERRKYSFETPLNSEWGRAEYSRTTRLQRKNELGTEKYDQRNRRSGAAT